MSWKKYTHDRQAKVLAISEVELKREIELALAPHPQGWVQYDSSAAMVRNQGELSLEASEYFGEDDEILDDLFLEYEERCEEQGISPVTGEKIELHFFFK